MIIASDSVDIQRKLPIWALILSQLPILNQGFFFNFLQQIWHPATIFDTEIALNFAEFNHSK